MPSEEELSPLDPLLVEFVKALARDHARRDNRLAAQRRREQLDGKEEQQTSILDPAGDAYVGLRKPIMGVLRETKLSPPPRKRRSRAPKE